MLKLIEDIKFRKINDPFQTTLRNDVRKIKNSHEMIIPADKTRNLYLLQKDQYNKLLRDNITKHYKPASDRAYNSINAEAKSIAQKLDLDDRTEILAKKEAFITLKDHKDNFEHSLPCRLINPAKSEIGIISKKILDTILQNIRPIVAVNQWKNSMSVIEWFKNLEDKNKHTFACFDICDFYPSITEKLLLESLKFAGQYTTISDEDKQIIMHARKSLLFDKTKPWVKKNSNGSFDVTMGSNDGAEICELVGIFMLHKLAKKYGKENIGLYRDDGLAAFKNITGSKSESIRKDITKTFKAMGLKITILTNLKTVNFLDITLNLNNGKYYPYRKPNDNPMYIHTQSNHPPSIIKNISSAIGRRISDISSDEHIFNQAAPLYQNALKTSGHKENITYTSTPTQKNKKNRNRNTIWFNPPYSKNVATNVGKRFLNLIAKHFPADSKLHKIFNRNNVKVSYSCMPNMATIIKAHNATISNSETKPTQKPCNCRQKDTCPLNGECQTENIVYQATVHGKQTKVYIGLTENNFKQRYANHKQSFKHEKHENSTELSKHIWKLKRNNEPFSISWSISKTAQAYTNKTKRCNLCLTEKLTIIKADKSSTLNKRTELISKCRHENKFYLSNFNRASIT